MPFGPYSSGGGSTGSIPSNVASDEEVAAAVADHEADTTNVHGIGNTGIIETTTGAQGRVDFHALEDDPHGDRAYADAVAQGLRVKESVVAATTANITLSGAQTIDGVSVVALDRVLVKDQTDAEDNGIYVASAGAWTRSADANSDAEVDAGLFTFVSGGTVGEGTSWVQTSSGPTLGADALVFSQFGSAAEVAAGAGLTKTGSTVDVVNSDGSITVGVDAISTTFGTTPSTQAFGDAAAGGSAATSSKNDHKHQMPTGTTGPDADVTIDATGAAGTANTASRSAHGHKLATYTTAAAAVGTASAGTSTTAPARGNHVHPSGAGTPSTQAMGDAAATGTGPAASMTDHKHAMPALGTSAAAVGTSAGGSAVTPSKSDHVHATGAGTPVTQAFGDAAAIGAGPAGAMTNHVHGMPANPVTAHDAASHHYSYGPVYKVDDYGAVGDGVTDDTDAIQDCIDAVPDTGGIVLFGAGSQYLLTADTATITGATYDSGDDEVTFTLDNFPNIFIDEDHINVRGIVSTGGDTADGGTYNGLWLVTQKNNTTVTCWADGIKDPGTYSSGGTATGAALYLRDKGGVTFQGLNARTQQASAGGSTLLAGTAGMICLVAQKTTTGNITHSGPTFRDLGFEDPNFDINLSTGATVAWSAPDGGTFTWTKAGHNFTTGDIVFAGQATNNGGDFEGVYTVTVDSSSSFRATGVGADPGVTPVTTNIAYQIVPEATAAKAVGIVIAGTTRYYAERLNFQGLQQAFALSTWASRDCSWGTLQACVWNQCKVGFKIWGDGGQSVNINSGNLVMHTGQVGFQGPEPESTKDMAHFRCTGMKIDTQHTSGADCIGFDMKNAKYFYIGYHSFEIEGDETTRCVRVGKDSSGTIIGLGCQHNIFGGVNYEATAIEIAGTNAGNSPTVNVFGGEYTNWETAIYIGPYAKGCQVFGGHHHTPGGSGQYGIRVDNATNVIGTSIVGFTSDTESGSVNFLDIPSGSDTRYDMCWTDDDGNPTWFTNQDPTAGQLTLSGASTTSTATGDITALAITNSVWRWNGASAATLHGIASGATGRVVILINGSTSQTLTIANNSTTDGTTDNRIHTGEQGDISVGPTSSVLLVWETTSDRWRTIRASSYSSAAAAIGTAAAGTAGFAPARGNHVHATGAGTPSTQAFGDAAATGTGPAAAMTDHKHAMPNSTTGPDANVTVDATGATGTSATAARSGHGHQLATYSSAAAATTTASGTAGTSTTAPARGDHTHQIGAHGATEHTDITRSLWLPAPLQAESDSGTGNTSGTFPDAMRLLTLADSATQGSPWKFLTPFDWASGALTCYIYWFPVATDATPHTVRWSWNYKELAAGGDVTAAGTTTTQTGSSAARTAQLLVIETAQAILTPSAANTLIRLDLQRIGADAADTYVGGVRVAGLRVDYTATQ